MTTIPHRLLTCCVYIFLATARPAAAGDGLYQACVGKVHLGESALLIGDEKGMEKLALVYEDHRGGADGDQREITVSMVYGNKTFVGKDLIKDTRTAKVTLRNVEDQNDIIFKGTVQGVGAAAAVIIDGEYTTGDKKTHHIHTQLESYNIPGPQVTGGKANG